MTNDDSKFPPPKLHPITSVPKSSNDKHKRRTPRKNERNLLVPASRGPVSPSGFFSGSHTSSETISAARNDSSTPTRDDTRKEMQNKKSPFSTLDNNSAQQLFRRNFPSLMQQQHDPKVRDASHCYNMSPLEQENHSILRKFHHMKALLMTVSQFYPKELNHEIAAYLDEDLELDVVEKHFKEYHHDGEHRHDRANKKQTTATHGSLSTTDQKNRYLQQQQASFSPSHKSENRLRKRITKLESDLNIFKERNQILKGRLKSMGQVVPPTPLENREAYQRMNFFEGMEGSRYGHSNGRSKHKHSDLPKPKVLESTLDVMDIHSPEKERISKLEQSLLDYESLHEMQTQQLAASQQENRHLQHYLTQQETQLIKMKRKNDYLQQKLKSERSSWREERQGLTEKIAKLSSVPSTQHKRSLSAAASSPIMDGPQNTLGMRHGFRGSKLLKVSSSKLSSRSSARTPSPSTRLCRQRKATADASPVMSPKQRMASRRRISRQKSAPVKTTPTTRNPKSPSPLPQTSEIASSFMDPVDMMRNIMFPEV